jgi:L-lactate dehydrogenase (cytochrome)
VPLGDAPTTIAPAAIAQQPDLQKPPLRSLMSSHDFERVASKTFTPKAWAFISSAATDCITNAKLNPGFFSRLILRPRILRDVQECDIKTRILGLETDAPFFIAPTAMQKLVHPLGEAELSRGAGAGGLIMAISNYSSFPLNEIIATALPGQHHVLQL